MKNQKSKLAEAENNLQRVWDLMELKRHSVEIFRNMPNLFVIVDFKGRLIFWNKNWERVFGFDPSELYGSYLFDYVAPEDKEATEKAFSGVLNSELKTIDEPFRNQYLTNQGNRVVVEWEAETPSHGNYVIGVAKTL